MKAAGALSTTAVLCVWLVWNLVCLYRMARGVRSGAWRRPMWWTRLCSVALFAGLASWIWGVLSEGLDTREECVLRHHQRYDDAYRAAHEQQARGLFPLHDKCNAQYDLVPAWVNPAMVSCAVVAVAAIAVLLVRRGCRRVGR
ncbi:hypothetical protein [Streptomyces montanisoli]|uniref:Uncharacterized protein n=1 Tax=Streptomyces montanisoli TaxID=2798581 RepID=A0A940MJC8_9ACTN|nr:hypothetical protein [Streptomyces montanisoli]MBP0461165.1 hypothetical protein [Streptomyces montanisoli]